MSADQLSQRVSISRGNSLDSELITIVFDFVRLHESVASVMRKDAAGSVILSIDFEFSTLDCRGQRLGVNTWPPLSIVLVTLDPAIGFARQLVRGDDGHVQSPASAVSTNACAREATTG
jgi:hypothetical protein